MNMLIWKCTGCFNQNLYIFFFVQKLYKDAWEITKPIGYTLDEKYIPVVGAKHSNYINSEVGVNLLSIPCISFWGIGYLNHLNNFCVTILQLKYKAIYEKLKGHYLAGKDVSEFPSVIHSLAFQKMRSAVRRDFYLLYYYLFQYCGI